MTTVRVAVPAGQHVLVGRINGQVNVTRQPRGLLGLATLFDIGLAAEPAAALSASGGAIRALVAAAVMVAVLLAFVRRISQAAGRAGQRGSRCGGSRSSSSRAITSPASCTASRPETVSGRTTTWVSAAGCAATTTPSVRSRSSPLRVGPRCGACARGDRCTSRFLPDTATRRAGTPAVSGLPAGVRQRVPAVLVSELNGAWERALADGVPPQSSPRNLTARLAKLRARRAGYEDSVSRVEEPAQPRIGPVSAGDEGAGAARGCA